MVKLLAVDASETKNLKSGVDMSEIDNLPWDENYTFEFDTGYSDEEYRKVKREIVDYTRPINTLANEIAKRNNASLLADIKDRSPGRFYAGTFPYRWGDIYIDTGARLNDYDSLQALNI
ncbi:hypothetical protein ACOIFF_03440 [Klebsiella pneumoniae]|uniref:hypothetical protein n=1 Tax=Klebsiella pneumoniae TaxID=573 RepID=UPI000807FA9E|nr:hypothetical protein [Klebsiella pneumoniae]MBZ1999407.1 hypothetical protein [Klebsiella pneumoniae]MCQ0735019.1 hypothetical protein [Klebsiella pneumoniae]MDD1879014.1 hypothetical protein [Klebsiella pneumoniae]MEB5562839.1 hypothetical protein [Klebsiella pneumoniae]MEC4502299.1 hypothetical protein [Klebsiella pneumoniae]